MITREQEAKQAYEAHIHVHTPQAVAEQLVASHAHDVLHSNHDRDFRGIYFFLHELLKEQAPMVGVRIFDIGRGCQQHEVTVHLLCEGRGEDCTQFLDLVAFRHHIRWAKPSTDVPTTKWRDWVESFQKVITYGGYGWKEHVKRNETDHDLAAWFACSTCKQRRKIPADQLVYCALGGGLLDTEEADPLMWIEPNHRTGAKGKPTTQADSTKVYPTAPLQDRTGAVGEVETERVEKFGPPRLVKLDGGMVGEGERSEECEKPG